MPSNYSAKEIRRIEAKRRKRMRRFLRKIGMATPKAHADMRQLGMGLVSGITSGIVFSLSHAVDGRGRILWASIGPKGKSQ